MWPKNKQFSSKIAELEGEIAKWRGRAYCLAGEMQQLEKEYDRVVQDNRFLAEKIVDVATRPPTIIPAEKVDVAAILEGVRRMVQPDIIVRGSESAEQVVNWSDQGLDNNGGVREFSDRDVERVSGARDPASIPEYVLDIERLTESDITNGKGGWYNPTQAAPR